MSSIVSYFHNVLGREEAEQKLVADRINKTYLGRRSPLNQHYYILSYQVNQVFKHEIVNAKPVSRGSVELENVLDILKEMVQSNNNCEHAVPSLLTHSQGGTQGEVGEAGHVHLPEAGEIEVGEAGHVHFPEAEEIEMADGAHDRPTVRPTVIPLRP